MTSRYAANFVSGMQGNDDKYLKVSSCCKHFADYSMEYKRGGWNDIVSEYDQNDTYLVAFKSCIVDANASGIMCSYNAENGIPSCANKQLLTNYLLNELKFNGYIVSDCDAVQCVQQQHKYTNNSDQTIADVFNAGMNIDCGTKDGSFTVQNNNTINAINDGAVSLQTIQQAIYKATLVQMRLGMYDSDSLLPPQWTKLNQNDVLSELALEISYNAAQQGQVLLKNNNNSLPLDNKTISSLALIGPNANNTVVMEGNYNGQPPFIYSVLDGIKKYVGNIDYVKGCEIADNDTSEFEAAINAAKQADITVMVMGLNQSQEREGYDRPNILLPGVQAELIKQACDASKGKYPCGLYLFSGS